jgi:ATP-dependent DNA ligase
LNGDDLRRDPLEVRKATLASIVAKASPGIRFNEQLSSQATASPSMMQERERRRANVSTISGVSRV